MGYIPFFVHSKKTKKVIVKKNTMLKKSFVFILINVPSSKFNVMPLFQKCRSMLITIEPSKKLSFMGSTDIAAKWPVKLKFYLNPKRIHNCGISGIHLRFEGCILIVCCAILLIVIRTKIATACDLWHVRNLYFCALTFVVWVLVTMGYYGLLYYKLTSAKEHLLILNCLDFLSFNFHSVQKIQPPAESSLPTCL